MPLDSVDSRQNSAEFSTHREITVIAILRENGGNFFNNANHQRANRVNSPLCAGTFIAELEDWQEI